MAREVEARLKLSAVDRTAKAFSAIERRLSAVNSKATAVNRAQAAVARTMDGAMLASARFLAPAIIAAGTAGAVKRFASVERSVGRIALTAGATADETKTAFSVIDKAASDYALAQDEIVRGLDSMVASGRSLPEAFAFLPSVAATAQAAGADIVEIATTADAIGSNFDIAGNKMQDAFDILATAGKLGKFELKDMASYLPSMAPAFAALGYRGETAIKKLAGWLQIVRARTGSASEAATSFSNVLQKMETNETATKFKEFGIDIRKEMAKARKEGKDLLQVFLDMTNKAIKGDLSKLPQLFGDAQMITGMRAMILGSSEMTGHMEALGAATGTVKRDLDVILKDSQADIDRLSAKWDGLVKSFGRGAVSMGATDLMEGAANTLDYHSAVNEGLEKKGVNGWWNRTVWGLSSSQDEKNRMAYDAGWRSTPLSDQGPMASSPELPSRRQDAARSSVIPIPQKRPDPRMQLPDLKLDRFAPIGAGYVKGLERKEMADWQKGREATLASRMSDMGGQNSFFRVPARDEWKDALKIDVDSMRQSGDAVAEAGKTAGQEIEKGAAFFKVAGVDVGAAIMQAANKLSDAASRLSNINLSVGTASVAAPKANADTGRSMPPSAGMPAKPGPF